MMVSASVMDSSLMQRLSLESAARERAEQELAHKSHELGEALARARESERRLQLALWASSEGIWEWSAEDGRLQFEAIELGIGWIDPVPGTLRELSELIHPDDRSTVWLAWRMHLRGSRPDVDVAMRCHGRDGAERWVRVRGKALERDADGRARRVIGTVKDITSQRDAEESLRLMAHAFSSTYDALVVTDRDWHILEINRAFCNLVRLRSQELAGRSLLELLDLGDIGLEQLPLQGSWRSEQELHVSGTSGVPVDVSVTAVLGEDGQRHCHIIAVRDISERRSAEEHLARMALQDALTGLPNRTAFQNHTEILLQQGQVFGLLFLDLDGFKEINDSYGHDAGDGVLKEVARRLQAVLPEGGLLGRWGGDEFVLVLQPGSGENEVRALAQTVIAALNRPIDIGAHEVTVTPSIGAVLSPRDGCEVGELLRKVDTAMYAAKERGRNCLFFFDDSLAVDTQRRVRMLSLMRTDAERNAFQFAAQPKVDADGVTLGAELLMRWPTEAFGQVSPAEFIPLAEQVGLISLMGRHAIHAAARLAAHGQQCGLALPVAVNLSPKQLLQPTLDRQLLYACQRHGITPALLELELTESALVQGMDLVAPLLHRLRKLGFVLALDDFGTGFSSLSYLRHLPFSKVKIDRSFVQDIDRDERAGQMLRHIVALCASIGMTTVAEGVETRAQLEVLRSFGVQEYQGYLFSRPLAADDWAARLERAQGRPLRWPA